MKRTHYVLAGIVIIAIFAIGLTGCEEASTQGTGAVLMSITVGGYSPVELPTAITKEQWNAAEDLWDYSFNPFIKDINFDTEAAMQNAAIVATASSGAKIAFATGSRDDKPGAFNANKVITLNANENFYVRVISEDGKKVNYYRFQAVPPNSNARLTRIAIGSIGLTPIDANSTVDTYNQPQEAGKLAISNSNISSEVVGTKAAASSTIQYAYAAGPALPAAEPSFQDSGAGFTFGHGDFLLVKVTAQKGNYRIYYFQIEVGTNANLSSLSIEGINAVLESPGATPQTVNTFGVVLLTLTEMPTGGVQINAVPEDSDATVLLAVTGNKTDIPAAWNFTAPYMVNDRDFLWIHVKSFNTQVDRYYKIQINLRQKVNIKIGSPRIEKGYIDPIWNDVQPTLQLDKIFKETADANPSWGLNPDTSATAKLLFDGMGVYAFVRVVDNNFIDANANVTSNFHMHDSFELFINEKGFLADGRPDTSVNNNETQFGSVASQYRVGAAGQRSGDPASALAALNNLDKTSAWKSTINGETNVYYVIMQAPWRHLSFNELTPQKKIGIELQVNACPSNGSRSGVVVWNNVSHSNYRNLSNYGVGVLDFNAGDLQVVADAPNITLQPSGDFYPANSNITLSVDASVSDAGKLTYQWYKTDTLTSDGTAIGSEVNKTLSISNLSVEGNYYYYVIVTNTLGEGASAAVRTAKSNVAMITIFEGEYAERLQLDDGAAALFKFTLPAGKKWSDYKAISWNVRFPAATIDRSEDIRLKLYGNYNPGIFGLSGGQRITNTGLSNDEANVYAQHFVTASLETLFGAKPAADVFNPITIEFASRSGVTAAITNWPANDAAGPFYFALGFTWYGSVKIDQIVKDVTLVGINPADNVVSYGSGFAEPAFVSYTSGSSRSRFDLSGSYKPVTGIPAVPSNGIIGGSAITLPQFANPDEATNKVISWTVADDGGTGAVIAAGAYEITGITAPGTVKLTATVQNGLTETAPFVEENITIVIRAAVQTAKILPEFTAGEMLVASGGGTVEIIEDGKGYQYNYGSGAYDPAFARFSYTFSDTERLADFKEVKFTFNLIQGDSENKTVRLVASPAAFESVGSGAPSGGINVTNNSGNLSTGSHSVSLAINSADALKLDANNTLWFSFYVHMAATGSAPSAGTPTKISFSGIEFIPIDEVTPPPLP